LFAAGDTVWLGNIGAGSCVVTAGTATVSKFSTASLTLSQYQGAYLYFVSTGVAILYSDSAGASTPLTTKGDLFGYDTANARVPIGTNNQVLTADSAQALGLKWATPTSGSYTLLSTTNFSGTSATISSINQTYKHLYITVEDVVPSAASNAFICYPGGNSPYGYRLETLGTSPTTNNQSYAGTFTTVQGFSTTSPSVGVSLLIENYATTNQYKFGMMKSAYKRDTAPTLVMALDVGAIPVASAISSLTIQFSGTGGTMTIKVYGVN
jgi:hypothetical protein